MYNFAADGEDVDRGGDSVHALLLPHQRALGKELWWGGLGVSVPDTRSRVRRPGAGSLHRAGRGAAAL